MISPGPLRRGSLLQSRETSHEKVDGGGRVRGGGGRGRGAGGSAGAEGAAGGQGRRGAGSAGGAAADRPGGAVLQRCGILPEGRGGGGRRAGGSVLPGERHQRPDQEHGGSGPRRRPHLSGELRQQRTGGEDAQVL